MILHSNTLEYITGWHDYKKIIKESQFIEEIEDYFHYKRTFSSIK